jgi:hypothetical protein
LMTAREPKLGVHTSKTVGGMAEKFTAVLFPSKIWKNCGGTQL